MEIPRLVIAGTHSGAGKTTITLGLLRLLRDRGYRVQPFKVGPDFIDPGLHRVAADRTSHNLDAWMGSESMVKEVFARHARNCDVAVVEGVMGLFDGLRDGDCGSTAHIARLLEAPIILVVNARGMARSCGALVKGYRDFDPRVKLAGVIFNNAGGPGHVSTLKKVIEDELGLPVLGTVRRNPRIVMPERHLGLLPAVEHRGIENTIKEMSLAAERDIDLKRLLEIARQASLWETPVGGDVHKPVCRVKLAVARDEAFNFYYRDSLDYLQELGARLVYFSPLNDNSLPAEIDGIYLGGGFPEMFLPRLAANGAMRESLLRAAQEGMPIYAECGGLMFLMERIIDFEGRSYRGVGLVPGQVEMQNKLAALGYVVARAERESILASPGEELRGHEFHYSRIAGPMPDCSAYRLFGGRGADGRTEGYVQGNLLASYIHIHFRYHPSAAKKFLKACAIWRDLN